MLAVVDDCGQISQISANSEQHFGIPPADLLGCALDKILEPGEGRDIIAKLAQLESGEEPALLGTVTAASNSARFHAIAHTRNELTILEFEPAETFQRISFHDVYRLLRSFSNRLRRTADVASLAELAATEVRRLTGFDRVLVYRFDHDWNGHVISESKITEWGSYLDLWFPASDIPEQARKIYQLNRLRLIVDSTYRPVDITPSRNPATGQPVDLTLASLRSVSPVHLEYLHNMGVGSSMSISLLGEDGRLWGLIASPSSNSALPAV